jgi:uncharacterized damage-inducible protein DinB
MADPAMNRRQALDALRASRAALLEAIDGLTPERLLQPRAVGEWSVRDVLQHVSLWEAELVRLLAHVEQGRRPTGDALSRRPDFAKINARWQAETRDRPLESVLEDLHGVRRQTIRRIEDLSEGELTRVRPEAWLHGNPLWRWVAEYSFEHELEHTEQIRTFRNGIDGR